MERLSSYAVDPVSAQLALLNLLLFVHLVCKGGGMRRVYSCAVIRRRSRFVRSWPHRTNPNQWAVLRSKTR